MTAHERTALAREDVIVIEPDSAALHLAPPPSCLRLQFGPAFVHVRPDGSGWRHCGPIKWRSRLSSTPRIMTFVTPSRALVTGRLDLVSDGSRSGTPTLA